ncbi:hypothetical protein K458DRAFT_133986 [Lentithecium fluviatile CBS 122367]|uniref:Uncharacterized protein n=1 Tax=Lentithecium fluviatile CBS 122367 TaxID=1168545 RepID=A0A6G1ILN3_9PLEO|nr:hypothetical protein K458DRAFT_133986 [Lentithecium fluviatile CBS 122367]
MHGGCNHARRPSQLSIVCEPGPRNARLRKQIDEVAPGPGLARIIFGASCICRISRAALARDAFSPWGRAPGQPTASIAHEHRRTVFACTNSYLPVRRRWRTRSLCVAAAKRLERAEALAERASRALGQPLGNSSPRCRAFFNGTYDSQAGRLQLGLKEVVSRASWMGFFQPSSMQRAHAWASTAVNTHVRRLNAQDAS